jgi:hypothetical protein
MRRLRSYAFPFAMLAGATVLSGQSAQPAAQPAPSGTPAKTLPAAPKKAPPAKPPAPAAMTNQDVIKLVKAKISEDLIIAKIKQSKTKFDVSVDGLVALKEGGVSDNVIAVMMDPAASAAPPPRLRPARPLPLLRRPSQPFRLLTYRKRSPQLTPMRRQKPRPRNRCRSHPRRPTMACTSGRTVS